MTRGNLYVSRHEVRRMLSGEPRASTRKARAEALERLAQDIDRFVGWPALAASLLADARMVRRADGA